MKPELTYSSAATLLQDKFYLKRQAVGEKLFFCYAAGQAFFPMAELGEVKKTGG